VSSEWRPDDSLLERGENDEVRGTRRVKDALEKHGIRYGDRVITSRDKGMDEVKGDLKRSGMPPGVEQWQVPIVVKPSGEALSFTGRRFRNMCTNTPCSGSSSKVRSSTAI